MSSRDKFPKDHIINIARKYVNLSDFRLNHKGEYESACRRKMMDKELKFLKRGKLYKSIGEETVRSVLNQLFKVKFVSIRPPWLINPKTHYRLELDGFNEKLGIAFEYQSAYHNIEYIKKKDKLKSKICKNRGLKLIIIPRDIMRDLNPKKSLETILKSEFKRLKIKKRVMNFKFHIFQPDFSKTSKSFIKKCSKKYNIKRDFRKNHSNLYHLALRHGFLEEICKHMTEGNHVSNYWTKSRIANTAKLYKTKKEFYKNESGAYYAAKQKGIFEKVCRHMIQCNRWSKKKILEACKPYTSLRDIRSTNTPLYSAVVRWKLIPEVNKLLS